MVCPGPDGQCHLRGYFVRAGAVGHFAADERGAGHWGEPGRLSSGCLCVGLRHSINDPWYPVGNGSLINILDNGIHLAQTMSFDELDRCLDLITYNGAKTLSVEEQYGIEVGKPANFLVLDARSPFEAVRQHADVLASIRHGDYLFKRPEPSYEIALDLI